MVGGPIVFREAVCTEEAAGLDRSQLHQSALAGLWRVVRIFNGSTQMLNAALAGVGLAYVPEDLAQPHLARGWVPPFPKYHLYYPSRRHASPPIALPVDALRIRSGTGGGYLVESGGR
jgi:DNA-binding transcriptional LysR family regulator